LSLSCMAVGDSHTPVSPLGDFCKHVLSLSCMAVGDSHTPVSPLFLELFPGFFRFPF
jgi:hypothetical protein